MDAILALIGNIGGKLLDKFFPDPVQANAAKLQWAQMLQTGEMAQLAADTQTTLAQLEIDKVEATSPSLLVSGWRPAIGWGCGIAIVGYEGLAYPLLTWMSLNFHIIAPPQLPDAVLGTLTGILGGLAGLRTGEKFKGVA